MIFFGAVALLAVASAIILGVVMSNRIATMRMSVIDDENPTRCRRKTVIGVRCILPATV